MIALPTTFTRNDMPVQDRYHQAVMRAIAKQGWSVIKQQVSLAIGQRRLWVDLRAVHSTSSPTSPILIEVKAFTAPSNVNALANAVGQYMLYKVVLKFIKSQEQLFLAVPVTTYHGILSETIGEWTLRELKIDLLVYDPENEEIIQWITS